MDVRQMQQCSSLAGQSLRCTCLLDARRASSHNGSPSHRPRPFVAVPAHSSRSVSLRAKRRDPLLAPFIQTGSGQQREDFTDLYNYLLQNRIIFIGSRINDEVATKVVASMLALEATDSQQDIKLYINSSGGMPYSVISIVDMIDAIKPDVSTIAFGQSASTATLLLAAGTKGKRHSLANARIMMHQPAGGAMGSADEVNITTSELNRTMRVVQSFYSKFTGLPLERVEEETDRDNFLSPQQAVDLGVIDSII